MARNQSRDPLVLTPHWHIDCRLPGELPDDRVISSRFLVNLPFGLLTLGLIVFFGWLFSTDLSLRSNIADWTRRMHDSRTELANIKQMQREYTTLAFKIENAHTTIKRRLFVSQFMTQLSRCRLGSMVIDSVEALDVSVIVRGNMTGTAEQGTRMIGSYVEALRKDPEIGARFELPLVTGFEAAPGGGRQNFELTFRYKVEQPAP